MNEYLQQLYKLYFVALHTHWNYVGANFEAIHEYASELQEFALESADTIVEIYSARNVAVSFEANASLNNNQDYSAAENLLRVASELHLSIDRYFKQIESYGYADVENALGDQSQKLSKYVYKLRQTLSK